MKSAIFDLDGTLYSGSTLKEYFIFGAKTLLRRGKLRRAFEIVLWTVLTKIHIISHIKAKHKVCGILISNLTAQDLNNFVDRLMSGINAQVVGWVDESRRKGWRVVLSTASPEEYCLLLGKRLAMDYVISTPYTKIFQDYKENRGVAKLRALTLMNLRPMMLVVTDHYDDIPLLQANTNGQNILVNPSIKTVGKLNAAEISYELMEETPKIKLN